MRFSEPYQISQQWEVMIAMHNHAARLKRLRQILSQVHPGQVADDSAWLGYVQEINRLIRGFKEGRAAFLPPHLPRSSESILSLMAELWSYIETGEAVPEELEAELHRRELAYPETVDFVLRGIATARRG